MKLKFCSCCGQEQDPDNFYTAPRNTCKSCLKQKNKDYYQNNKDALLSKSNKYAEDNKENRKEYSKDYYYKNKDYFLTSANQWRLDNPQRYRENCLNWHKRNPIKSREYAKSYRLANPAKINAKSMWQHISKTRRMPAWLTKADLDEIQDIYAECRFISASTKVKHHVDHIIPLNGENVSGLHVPSNLQIVTASFNLHKGNRYVV